MLTSGPALALDLRPGSDGAADRPGCRPACGTEALDGLPVRNAARPVSLWLRLVCQSRLCRSHWRNGSASLRLCMVLTTACRDLLPVPLALDPLPVSIIQHGSAVRSYRAMISGDDRAASRSGYGLPAPLCVDLLPGPLGPLLSGCMGCALRSRPFDPSPGWFRALRCLHCAALIFDPWPWLLVGLCRSSPLLLLVLASGLAPASCECLALPAVAFCPALSCDALCGPLTGAMRLGMGICGGAL